MRPVAKEQLVPINNSANELTQNIVSLILIVKLQLV